jgi:hypothetical protein
MGSQLKLKDFLSTFLSKLRKKCSPFYSCGNGLALFHKAHRKDSPTIIASLIVLYVNIQYSSRFVDEQDLSWVCLVCPHASD